MKIQVPTENSSAIYRTRDGKETRISEMDVVELMTALYDMLMRKAKHNHKINKMLEVGDLLGSVTKSIHQELGTREAATITELINLQASADLGKLTLSKDNTSITLESNIYQES